MSSRTDEMMVFCENCGWKKSFREGAYRSDTPLELSAKHRRSGHVSRSEEGCEYSQTHQVPVGRTKDSKYPETQN